MQFKKFFIHTGLALGYLLFFFLLQSWISGLYAVGASAAFALRAPFNPFTFEADLTALIFEQIDIIMLLTYLACIAFYGCFLIAEQPASPLRAANIRKPRHAPMLFAPMLLGVSFFFAAQGSLMLIPEDALLMQNYLESISILDVGRFPFLSFVTTVFCAPLIEEIVFRGLIYRHLKRAMPLWLAIVLQAFVFAAAHGQLLWMTYTFVLGVIFALLYDYFDSLWPSILAHLCFNGCNFLPFLEHLWLEPTGWTIIMLASLLLCALTLLMLVLYRRMAHTLPKGVPTMPDAILFDFNGTLFFDGALQESAWRTYLATLIGRPVTDDEFRDHIHGRSAAATFSYFLKREVPQAEAEVLEEQKELIYRSLCLVSPDFRLEDGVAEFLDELKTRGIPFTIATASALPNVRFFFEHLPLAHWFDFDLVVYSDGSLPGKPAPDLYLKAAQNLHADPARCIIFEDAKSGILAAKNARACKVVGVTSSMTKEDLTALGADITIDGYRDPNLIEKVLS